MRSYGSVDPRGDRDSSGDSESSELQRPRRHWIFRSRNIKKFTENGLMNFVTVQLATFSAPKTMISKLWIFEIHGLRTIFVRRDRGSDADCSGPDPH